MSKSLKNFITIDTLLKDYSGDDFRMFCLLNYYAARVQLDDDGLRQAKETWSDLQNVRTDSVSHVESPTTPERASQARRFVGVSHSDRRVDDATGRIAEERRQQSLRRHGHAWSRSLTAERAAIRREGSVGDGSRGADAGRVDDASLRGATAGRPRLRGGGLARDDAGDDDAAGGRVVRFPTRCAERVYGRREGAEEERTAAV